MPSWVKPYRIQRASNIISFSVQQNQNLLETGGEACFLFKRYARANETFQLSERRVSTITKSASAFTTDPDTGMLRYLLWQSGRDPVDEYPDIGVFTCTVSASASTDV